MLQQRASTLYTQQERIFDEMKFIIAKNPINLLNYQPSCSLFRFHVPSLVHSSSTKWTHGSKTLRFSFSSLRASCASTSTIYGGWDDLSGSESPGEFDALRNFLVSVGIDDRKNVFVFLLGLICAMAISRVKVSSVLILPASALVFAVGFTVGFFRNGILGDVRMSGSKRRDKEENLKPSSEKLRSLMEFFDELDVVVNNLKSDVQSAIRSNRVQVDDFYGYVEVADKIQLSALNARNIVKTLIDNEEKSSGVLVENNKTGRRKKQVGEAGYQMLKSIGSLFGENLNGSNSTKVRESVEKALDQTRGNGTVPAVEGGAFNLVDDQKANAKLDSSQYSSTNSVLDMDKNGRIKTDIEKENFGLGDNRRSTNKFLDEKGYSYRNKGLRFTNNRSFSLKMDSSSITDMWESHDNLLDSESFNVRMKHMESESSFLHEQLLNQGHETFRSSHNERDSRSDRSQYKEDKVNYDDRELSANENGFNTPSSTKISEDMVFDMYLAEATDLLKQAKEFIKDRYGEEQAEIMLYRSANLLSNAVDLKPRSLLAVGQLGNTYLLHGELKLKISRELRTLLSGSIQASSGKRSRIVKELRNKITSKEEGRQLLIDVCEECEELLVEAGRKYRLALSIDANDVRALYNWGLALSFRGQLIADIGPGAAFEAERVFLAAIDKFDAMLLKGNIYAPDALFRWGMTLQQRSRLRPGSSKEKVKLLQQAKRLYEDALDMDSNNMQVKDALSSCVSELNYRQF
ncbi:Tetratricopeptide-like helical domain superfamily [Sesbania bispinosa]|nr:Tetratricopeptide-like helical domain superfamily [Sesbania bispinosa]